MKKANKNFEPDVLIVGGGVAGISAAIWCRELGLQCTLVEGSGSLGGQVNRIFSSIVNYPGILTIEPNDLVSTLASQLSFCSVPVINANAVGFKNEPLSIELSNGESICPRTLIIATGVRRRRLDVPGESEFAQRGIIDSGAREPSAVTGRSVLIVGGGDAAIENAIILAPFAKKVFVVHRRTQFSARGEFISQAKVFDNVEFLTNTSVVRFDGADGLETVTIRNSLTEMESSLNVQNALIRIGVTPNSELFKDAVKTDSTGYIVVDSACGTNRPSVFAAGDVANPVGPTIASAVGMGATAAKAAFTLTALKKSI